MKILFMGARADEMPAADAWRAAHPEHEVTTTSDILTLATVDQLDAFDAVTTQQVLAPEPEIGARLEEVGITQISSRTAGVDMFDLADLRSRGIAVTNVPVYSPNAIAEFVLASTLHLTRRFPVIDEKLRAHDFRFAGMIGRELATLRVAVIGTGSIGLRTARLFHALGATVVGYDPYPRPDFGEVGTYLPTLLDAIDGADVVSLHMPSTPLTHHLISTREIAAMAEGSILVNAARGGILDTQALIDALDAGHLMGAALDVYENEARYFRYDWEGKDLGDPLLEQLLEREDVLLTPHVAFYTETAVTNLVTGGLDNAVAVVENGTCDDVVN